MSVLEEISDKVVGRDYFIMYLAPSLTLFYLFAQLFFAEALTQLGTAVLGTTMIILASYLLSMILQIMPWRNYSEWVPQFLAVHKDYTSVVKQLARRDAVLSVSATNFGLAILLPSMLALVLHAGSMNDVDWFTFFRGNLVLELLIFMAIFCFILTFKLRRRAVLTIFDYDNYVRGHEAAERRNSELLAMIGWGSFLTNAPESSRLSLHRVSLFGKPPRPAVRYLDIERIDKLTSIITKMIDGYDQLKNAKMKRRFAGKDARLLNDIKDEEYEIKKGLVQTSMELQELLNVATFRSINDVFDSNLNRKLQTLLCPISEKLEDVETVLHLLHSGRDFTKDVSGILRRIKRLKNEGDTHIHSIANRIDSHLDEIVASWQPGENPSGLFYWRGLLSHIESFIQAKGRSKDLEGYMDFVNRLLHSRIWGHRLDDATIAYWKPRLDTSKT